MNDESAKAKLEREQLEKKIEQALANNIETPYNK